ncbi:MAG: 50S ribosomal protein L15 [Planctomycetaceae bacterium]
MILDDVHRGIKKNKKRKRIGRGPGSGHGKTSGRGHKGYYSRSGSSRRVGFEGGQMPIFRIVAKRGFNNRAFAPKIAIVNIAQLDAVYESGEEVTLATLKEKRLITGRFDLVKVLGNGELTKKLTVSAHKFSAGAEQKIAAAGGTIQRIAS